MVLVFFASGSEEGEWGRAFLWLGDRDDHLVLDVLDVDGVGVKVDALDLTAELEES